MLQQLPLHERFATEKAYIQSALGTQRFFQPDIDTLFSCFPVHGMLVLAPGVAIPATQGTVMRKAQCELQGTAHGWVGVSVVDFNLRISFNTVELRMST